MLRFIWQFYICFVFLFQVLLDLLFKISNSRLLWISDYSGTCLDWAKAAGHYDSVSKAINEAKGNSN